MTRESVNSEEAVSPAQEAALLDAVNLHRLACPACLGTLSSTSSGNSKRLVCTMCGRVYPVIGAIPVLIAERAE
jgi:uncharacterized protein YbaR (Trm112 family)